MPGRNAQITRVYTALTILEGAPQGLTVAELTERLNDRGHKATKRTIYRDLEALQETGFPLTQEGETTDEGASRWRLERLTRVANHFVLTSRELLGLYLARGALTPLRDTPFFADLESIFQKIELRLGTQSRAHLNELSTDLHFEPGPRWGLGIDPDLLETVRAACAERHVLQTRYTSSGKDEERERRLGPHFLYFARGSLYLVAEDLETTEVKIFGVPRMRDAVMLDESYDRTPVDPEDYFRGTFGLFRESTPVPVRIEFSSVVAAFVRERRWHGSQSVVSKTGGAIVVSLDVSITPELVQWVLGFGPNALVTEPPDLIRRVTEAATQILEKYRKPKAA